MAWKDELVAALQQEKYLDLVDADGFELLARPATEALYRQLRRAGRRVSSAR